MMKNITENTNEEIHELRVGIREDVEKLEKEIQQKSREYVSFDRVIQIHEFHYKEDEERAKAITIFSKKIRLARGILRRRHIYYMIKYIKLNEMDLFYDDKITEEQ
eukprot:Pgem_evm1s12480